MVSNTKTFAIVMAMVLGAILSAERARADQTDPRLPELFEALRLAPDENAALHAERAITKLWHQGGAPDLTKDLAEAKRLIQRWSFDQALEILNELIARAPRFAEAWNTRATLHYIEHKYNASIVDVERTLELEPRHFGALAGLGEIRFTSGQLHDALKAFKRALAVHPNLPLVKYRVGMLREKLGQVTSE